MLENSMTLTFADDRSDPRNGYLLCDDCDEEFAEDELAECCVAHCRKQVCGEHQVKCSGCGAVYCRADAKECLRDGLCDTCRDRKSQEEERRLAA